MNVTEILSNPTVQKAFKQEYGEEVLNEMLYGSMNLKQAKALAENLSLEEACRLLVRIASLLSAIEFDEKSLGELTPLEMGIANLEYTALKALLKTVVNSEHFKARSRKSKTSDSSYTEGYTL